MNNPKFSVITVSYQHVDFIRQTIESVLLQQYPNFEHIVVDGGSTDGTIEILKAYPHLKWSSEPDRGQSHALNKGFAQATGDIIAWINSDDWYPPGIFKDVALALEEYPIVMGACEVCDKYGVRQHVVKNYERTWHDLIKHWVFCSSPSQPSIFFRRELLEQVKYGPGNYLDEDLEFCMDLDLWLRMAEHVPFARRLPRVLSYLRTYETNKTGEMMDLTYREMSRVYERHVRRRVRAETRMSVVMPVGDEGAEFKATVESLKLQTSGAAELLVVDYGTSVDQSKLLRRQVLEVARTVPNHTLRYVRTEPGCVFSALNHATQSARATLMTVLQPGDALPPQWTESCEQHFRRDNTGFALMYGPDPQEREMFLQRSNAGVVFRPDGIFISKQMLPNFVARTIALQEIGVFRPHAGSGKISPLLALRQLMFRLLNKGWAILGDHQLALRQSVPPLARIEAVQQAFQVYVNAQMIHDLQVEFEGEPFAQERKQHGFTVALPDHVVTAARALIAKTPPDWPMVLADRGNRERLLAWVERAPDFLPAWYFLAEVAESTADHALLIKAKQGATAAEREIAAL